MRPSLLTPQLSGVLYLSLYMLAQSSLFEAVIDYLLCKIVPSGAIGFCTLDSRFRPFLIFGLTAKNQIVTTECGTYLLPPGFSRSCLRFRFSFARQLAMLCLSYTPESPGECTPARE